jgi:FlaA1/EpsC-like NDP-sugar epimerase
VIGFTEPGEKLYEELLSDQSTSFTTHRIKKNYEENKDETMLDDVMGHYRNRSGRRTILTGI